MTITQTIDTQMRELARAYETNSARLAELAPTPVGGFVRRIGALNAEAIRQSGHLTVTAIDAASGLATAAWAGATGLASTTEQALGSSTETFRTTGRRVLGDVRQASSTITNRARKASDEIGHDLRAVGDRAEKAGDDIGRKARRSGARVVKATDTATAETSAAGADRPTGSYENWTREELYQRAQELDIEGRSGMTKKQLVKALRDA